MRLSKMLLLTASIATLAIGIGTAAFEGRPREVAAQENTSVTGCIEQDAASRTPAYKLVAKGNNGTQIYRLTAPSSIDLGAELGHSVAVTGALTKRGADRGGREELELAVRSLKRVADRCD